MAARIDTHTHVQCSPTSVGFAGAHPNYYWWLKKNDNFTNDLKHDINRPVVFYWKWRSGWCTTCLGTRPSKNWEGGSGKWTGVEVYTAPGVQVYFQLAFWCAFIRITNCTKQKFMAPDPIRLWPMRPLHGYRTVHTWLKSGLVHGTCTCGNNNDVIS